MRNLNSSLAFAHSIFAKLFKDISLETPVFDVKTYHAPRPGNSHSKTHVEKQNLTSKLKVFM